MRHLHPNIRTKIFQLGIISHNVSFFEYFGKNPCRGQQTILCLRIKQCHFASRSRFYDTTKFLSGILEKILKVLFDFSKSYQYFPYMYGRMEVQFPRFNTVSRYGQIGPTLRHEPLTLGREASLALYFCIFSS